MSKEVAFLPFTGRQITKFSSDGLFSITEAKADDVPMLVAKNYFDAGICGTDSIVEYGKVFETRINLPFSACEMAFAGKLENKEAFMQRKLKIYATKFPNTLLRYLEADGQDVNTISILPLRGGVEMAATCNIADAIFDIVESGQTLKENGLEVYKTVFPISAEFIRNGQESI